jgi:carboxymethylenebutenolidase
MAVPGEVLDRSSLTESRIRLDGTVDAYLVEGAGDGPRPGIVVIHEAFGPVDHIDDVARRFANVGYDAIAPNLYTRGGAPTPDDLPDVMDKMFGLADSQAVADLEAAAAHLRSLRSNNGRVGCVGFCSGGRQTLLMALSSEAIDAAAPCWGGFIDRADPDHGTSASRPTPIVDMTDGLSCPLLVVGGATDTNPSPGLLAELEGRLEGADHPVRLEIFDDAGHAFFADYRDSYQPEAAARLWPMLLEFFGQHLTQGASA